MTVARNLSRPFQGRLFFAGEQASPGFFGYMEGALERACGRVPGRRGRGPHRRGRPAARRGRGAGARRARGGARHGNRGGRRRRGGARPETEASDGAERRPACRRPSPAPRAARRIPCIRKGSRRPAVGYAQQCLNGFLSRHQAGTAGCMATTAEVADFAVADASRRSGRRAAAPGRGLPVRRRHRSRGRMLQACFGLDRDGAIGKDTWPVLHALRPARRRPPAPRFRILLDTRRDGTLAPARPGWRWGAVGHGAVVLVNNDDDGSTGRPDNEDAVVDGGQRRRRARPAGDRGRLAGARRDGDRARGQPSRRAADLRRRRGRVRRRSSGPRPARGTASPPRSRPATSCGWRAVRYARRGFSGEVTLTLRTTLPLQPPETQTATVRVAPWIIPNHLDRAERVYVADAGSSNDRFRTELRSLVDCRRLHAGPDPLRRHLGAGLHGVRLRQHPRQDAADGPALSSQPAAAHRGAGPAGAGPGLRGGGDAGARQQLRLRAATSRPHRR